MTDPRITDQVIAAIERFLPRTPDDLARNLRAVLQAALDRLDLVTREELDVQTAVLAHTRARLETLERQVAVLEASRSAK